MTTHSRMSRSLLALTALAVFALAGCGDSVSPGEDFDATLTSTAAEDVYDAIDGNAAVQSMGILGEYFPQFAAAPVATMLPNAPWNPGDWSAGRLSAMQTISAPPGSITRSKAYTSSRPTRATVRRTVSASACTRSIPSCTGSSSR